MDLSLSTDLEEALAALAGAYAVVLACGIVSADGARLTRWHVGSGRLLAAAAG